MRRQPEPWKTAEPVHGGGQAKRRAPQLAALAVVAVFAAAMTGIASASLPAAGASAWGRDLYTAHRGDGPSAATVSDRVLETLAHGL